jgi:hypothetical protein
MDCAKCLTTLHFPLESSVWALSLSLAAIQEIVLLRDCFLFLQVLECFTSLGALLNKFRLQIKSVGFPHSDISGSKIV